MRKQKQTRPTINIEVKAFGRGKVYYVNGDKFPGVTTVLGAIGKPALIIWAKNLVVGVVETYLRGMLNQKITLDEAMLQQILAHARTEPDKIKTETANLGTRTHEAIMRILQGENGGVTDDIALAVKSFLTWKTQNPFTVVHLEKPVASLEYGYAGRPDMIAKDKDGYFVADWKTSKDGTVYKETAMQLAAYSQAIKETLGLDVKRGIALGLGRDVPAFKPFIVTNMKESQKDFYGTLRMYNGLKRMALEEMILTTGGKVQEW